MIPPLAQFAGIVGSERLPRPGKKIDEYPYVHVTGGRKICQTRADLGRELPYARA
jgi:hypothetical protein